MAGDTYWSSPIRVYLALSLLLFGFMGLTNTHIFSLDLNAEIKEGVNKPYEDLSPNDISLSFGGHFFETQKSIDQRNASRDFKLLELKLKPGSGENTDTSQASSDLSGSTEPPISDVTDQRSQQTGELEPITTEEIQDAFNQVEEELNLSGALKITPAGSDEPINYAEYLVGFVKSPAALTRSFNTYLPRLMFFMMPFTMLIGVLFIRGRKNAMMYDHLVHAAYIHAFAFFLLFTGIVLSRLVAGSTVFNVIVILLLIYLPISLKRMFGRGWIKTIWTAYGVGAIYLLILTVSLSGLIVWDLSKALT